MSGDVRSAVVLAAGASRRLGTPKQLLPYRDTTLLGATLGMVHGCGFDQIVLALGTGAKAVRSSLDLGGIDVVEVEEGGSGCGTSLRAAVAAVDGEAAGLVLFLGDQPGIAAATVERLMERGRAAQDRESQIVLTRYRGTAGHPFWLHRSMFGEIARLRGDKGLWRLIASGRFDVSTVEVDTPIPPDVDTWDDYAALLASAPT